MNRASFLIKALRIGAFFLVFSVFSGVPVHAAAPVSTTCATNGDCVIKDVGSCCGYHPACINKEAIPDPEAVKAECARLGVSGICGYAEIESCTCVNGQCQDGTPKVNNPDRNINE